VEAEKIETLAGGGTYTPDHFVVNLANVSYRRVSLCLDPALSSH
jgi:hypothetical protein